MDVLGHCLFGRCHWCGIGRKVDVGWLINTIRYASGDHLIVTKPLTSVSDRGADNVI